MAFAQITYRESLRDIEACLGSQPSKLYGMGLRGPVARSTLADANELRDWRIWSDLAAVLIKRARKLYMEDDIGLDLVNTVYALDSTTIDLCLSLFPWADFRSTKAAVKMHTLLDLRGPIPSFIHVSNGKMGDALALDLITLEAGAIYVMDRGYIDFRRLYAIHQAGAFFVTMGSANKLHQPLGHGQFVRGVLEQNSHSERLREGSQMLDRSHRSLEFAIVERLPGRPDVLHQKPKRNVLGQFEGTFNFVHSFDPACPVG